MIAGRGRDRDRLEHAVGRQLQRVVVVAGDQQVGDRDHAEHQHQAQERRAFRVAPVDAEAAAAPRDEVQPEVHRADQHEEHRDQLDRAAVEVAHAGVVVGEPADRDRRERVPDRVEHAHAGEEISRGAGGRDRDVDDPQHARGLGDARRELGVLDRPRHLRPVERHAAHAEHRQQRDREDHDAHAAEPLHLLPVIEHGARQRLEADQHGRAGGREARHRLEDRVGEPDRRLRRDVERQRARDAEHGPEQRHDDEPVAQAQVAPVTAHGPPDGRADRQQPAECGEEGRESAVAVEQRNAHRRQHRQAEHHQQQPEDALDGAKAHPRQNPGLSSTRIGKISRRPSSIAIVEIHSPDAFTDRKLEATSPRPGPTLLMQVAMALNAVI